MEAVRKRGDREVGKGKIEREKERDKRYIKRERVGNRWRQCEREETEK